MHVIMLSNKKLPQTFHTMWSLLGKCIRRKNTEEKHWNVNNDFPLDEIRDYPEIYTYYYYYYLLFCMFYIQSYKDSFRIGGDRGENSVLATLFYFPGLGMKLHFPDASGWDCVFHSPQ